MERLPRMRLVEAPNIGAFLDSPRGAYVVGRVFVYFQTASDVTGYLVWGSPGIEDVDAIMSLVGASISRLPAHGTLVDGRGLEGPPVRLFERLASFIGGNPDELRAALTKVALVRGSGIAGAVVGGFFDVVRPPYPVQLFDDLSGALEWLGAADPAQLAEQLEAVRDEACGVPQLLRRFRARVQAALPRPEEEAIARSLGVSRRTLQRRLVEHGTTFASEVSRVRADAAVALLETTDDPLAQVASGVGCPSLASFSKLVKKVTGHTPSEIRAKKRGA